MMTRAKWFVCLVLGAGVLCPSLCSALVTIDSKGRWPDTWPEGLEPYRNQAKTIGVHHGIQETVYEIRFDKREDFERAWPHFLKLKSKGAPLILESSPSYYGTSGSTAETGVRILCPSGGVTSRPSGKELRAGAPWPDSIKSPTGELPEYVVAKDDKWVPFDGTNRRGFIHRARVDIVLITDGKIIDLNHIRLPADTPIIDRRKLEGKKAEAEKPSQPDVAVP